MFIFFAKCYSQPQSDYLLFAVKSSERSNSWLFKMLRINNCWVLITIKGSTPCPLRFREPHTRGDRKNTGAYDMEEGCKMSPGHDTDIAIETSQQLLSTLGPEQDWTCQRSLVDEKGLQGAIVSQKLLVISKT